MRRLLGSDSPVELALIGVYFVLYLVVDRITLAMADLALDDLGRPSLVLAAADRGLLLWLGVAVLVAAGLTVHRLRDRALARWSALDHGSVLRLLAAPLILFLVWRGALYPYNFFAGQAHLFDRGLLLILAAATIWRPLFLVPFALQFRVISAQTIFPFATAAYRNIDDLPVIVLLLVAVGHLLFVVTGRRSSSVIILAVGAAIAAHFYIPGKGKLLMGWLADDDIANLPLASYTAGWLGHTDGSTAEAVASLYDRLAPLVKGATLVVEVGAVLAVAHRRLLRPWLVAWVGFHIATFVTTGFFFIGWILAELGLLLVLTINRGDLRDWVNENATWARAGVAVLATVGAPVLFHPPGLAWFDAPVSYGYRLEGIGASGATYQLPASTLAPLDHEVMFKRLQLTDTAHLSGAYGALESSDQLDELDGVEDLSGLTGLEANQPSTDPDTRARSVDLLAAFVTSTHDDGTLRLNRWLHRLNPPPMFWSSWSSTDYRFDEPLNGLNVTLLTRVHPPSKRHDGVILTRTDPVLALSRGPDGTISGTLGLGRPANGS